MEDILAESKIGKFKLSKETKKYYDFIIKKLPRYKEKAKDKEKYNSIYKELKSRSKALKEIYDKAFDLEIKFMESNNFRDRSDLNKKYKQLGKESEDILNKSKKDFNKLKNLLIAGGMAATAVAGAFIAVDTYDDYMHSFSRFMHKLAYPTKPENVLDRIGQAKVWKFKRMFKEDINYFLY